MQQVLYDRRSMIHPVARGAKDRKQYSWWDLFLGSSFEMDDSDDLLKEENKLVSALPFRKRKRSSCLLNDSISVVSSNASYASEPKAKKAKNKFVAIFSTPIKPILKLGLSRQNTFSKLDCVDESSMLPPRKSLARRSCSILRPNPTAMGPPPSPSPQTNKSASVKRQQSTDKDMRQPLTRSWSQSFASLNGFLPDKEIKRQEAIYELYSCELSMVEDLQLVSKTYRHSMVRLQILTEQEDQNIFENLDVLLKVHMDLRDNLDALKSLTGVVDAIGKVILEWIPTLQCYISYCRNYYLSKGVLQRKIESSPKLRDFLQRCLESPFSRRLDLLSFLDVPRSRFVKYPLLMAEIIRHTEPLHEDCKLLQQALPILQSLLKKADEAFGASECQHYKANLVWPSHLKPDNMQSASLVICHGELRDRRGNKVYCFLFDTGFLLTRQSKEKYLISHKLIKGAELHVSEAQPLRTSFRTSLKPSSPPMTFQVGSSLSSSPLLLTAETAYSKHYWVQKLQNFIQNCGCSEESGDTTTSRSSSSASSYSSVSSSSI